MACYRVVGEIPHKRHTQFRKPGGGLYAEELMGVEGFSSDAALLYHERIPTAIVAADVRLSYCVSDVASPLYRNAVGDECVYVASGSARFESTHRWVPTGDEPLRTLINGKEATEELAVMVDTFRPLDLCGPALEREDTSYAWSRSHRELKHDAGPESIA